MVPVTGLELHLRPGMGADNSSHQFLNWWQQVPTGHLYLNWFESSPYQQKEEA